MPTEKPLDILGNSSVQMAAKHNELQDRQRAQIADALISTKTWSSMAKKERELCIHYLINESTSEADLRHRLAEIGVGYVAVSWQDVDQNDKTSREAQILVKALGGPIAKNGAMVMVDTIDDFN